MIKNLLFITLLSSFLIGCKQDDLTPSWLAIDEFTLTTNLETEGSNSHGITDAWIFMDGRSLGVFELPCKIPVLDEGEHNFIIFAGIKNNGISSTRIRYPFYNTYDVTGVLTLNDTLHLSPTTTYKSDVTFEFNEDFEDPGIGFVKGPTSDTDIVFVDDPTIVKYGDRCGGIFLTNPDSVYTGSTMSVMNLPKGEAVFLELDYKNNNSLAMGVIARFPDGSVDEHTILIIMNAQPDGEEVWKKIYVDLKEDVSFNSSVSSFEIYFLAVKDSELDEGRIFIDNVKVVHNQ
ncbi:MAG: hypothetical protein GQ574_14260 [Crocinitomix sp.]|nr:hypothetical protein [Crocinitomix sp.]